MRSQITLSGIADDTMTIDSSRVGVMTPKSAALGTVYIDQYESRRQNLCGPES